MLLGMKQDVLKIVSAIAADFSSPAGPITLERILRKHHQSMIKFREQGLTWDQISRVLAEGGIKRRDGRSFPPARIRGVFGRHRKRAPEPKSNPTHTRRNSPSAAADLDRHIPAFLDVAPRSVEPHGLSSQKGEAILSGQQTHRSEPNDRAQALAVMRQSVRARRISE